MHIKNALRDLNFEANIKRFGMFFLHDLRLGHGLETLDAGDAGAINKAIGINHKRRQNNIHSNAPQPIDRQYNTEPSEKYPLGESPTWSQIQHCLKHSPLLLIRPWTWKDTLDIDPDTSELIVKFTLDLWLSLNEKVLRKPIPQIKTLEKAMEMWSAASVDDHLLHVTFLPNACNISTRKMSSWSFTDLASVYFPDPNSTVNPKSAWGTFLEKGYLGRLKEFKADLPEYEFEKLTNNIQFIFGEMQCLPHSITKGRGNLWKSRAGSIEILTNPKCYKLVNVGKERRRVIRVNARQTEISARLGKVHHGISVASYKRERRKQERSSRSRNKRNPPKRKRN
jgi:hypothetical protein